MKYIIEATDDGYKLSIDWETHDNLAVMHEVGGHGPIENLYGQVERTWTQMREAGVKPERVDG